MAVENSTRLVEVEAFPEHSDSDLTMDNGTIAQAGNDSNAVTDEVWRDILNALDFVQDSPLIISVIVFGIVSLIMITSGFCCVCPLTR